MAKSVILRPFFRKIRQLQQYPLCAGLACCYVHVYSMAAVVAAPDIGKPVKRTAFQQALSKRVPYPKNEELVAERACYSRASFLKNSERKDVTGLLLCFRQLQSESVHARQSERPGWPCLLCHKEGNGQ